MCSEYSQIILGVNLILDKNLVIESWAVSETKEANWVAVKLVWADIKN
ncbi:MAG: hypothetical protein G01um10147_850 [Microgenomates group bacterium Gr01-1014_7]|nr:MAG: hypothetical protein G01um10147_850 [Microgenomates group bacterium Gr01-1014_7]